MSVCARPSNILACRLYYTISAAHCGREPRGPGKGQGESHGPRAGEKGPFPPQPMYSGPRAFPLAVPWTPWLSATVRCAYVLCIKVCLKEVRQSKLLQGLGCLVSHTVSPSSLAARAPAPGALRPFLVTQFKAAVLCTQLYATFHQIMPSQKSLCTVAKLLEPDAP